MPDRTWVMVDEERQCGACGHWIAARTWFLEAPQARRPEPRIRCRDCAWAEGATPPDADWPDEAPPS